VDTLWWNASWTSRYRIDVRERGGATRRGFPVLARIPSTAVNGQGRDVRVIDDTGNEIISQTKANSSPTTLVSDGKYTEVFFLADLGANAVRTYYIYAGNPSAPLKTYADLSGLIYTESKNQIAQERKIVVRDNFNLQTAPSLGVTQTNQVWQVLAGSFGIQNNGVQGAGGETDSVAVVDSRLPDASVIATLGALSPSSRVIFRADNTGTNYLFVEANTTAGTVRLAKCVNSVITTLASADYAWKGTEEIRVDFHFSFIKVFVDGVQVLDIVCDIHNRGGYGTIENALGRNDTALTLQTGAEFPDAAPFRALIDQEEIEITAGAGTNDWTITRGVNGIRQEHPAQSVVRGLKFAAHGVGFGANNTVGKFVNFSVYQHQYGGDPVYTFRTCEYTFVHDTGVGAIVSSIIPNGFGDLCGKQISGSVNTIGTMGVTILHPNGDHDEHDFPPHAWFQNVTNPGGVSVKLLEKGPSRIIYEITSRYHHWGADTADFGPAFMSRNERICRWTFYERGPLADCLIRLGYEGTPSVFRPEHIVRDDLFDTWIFGAQDGISVQSGAFPAEADYGLTMLSSGWLGVRSTEQGLAILMVDRTRKVTPKIHFITLTGALAGEWGHWRILSWYDEAVN